jgi:hypothetical protein
MINAVVLVYQFGFSGRPKLHHNGSIPEFGAAEAPEFEPVGVVTGRNFKAPSWDGAQEEGQARI